MSVSVVICAYTMDRWDSLVAAVRSCFDQTLKPDEVVVVIDYNEDLFARATLEFSDAFVVANSSSKGLSGARNTGVSSSTGEIVVFLDDDAYGEPAWLENLTAPMDDPLVAGVGGWILPYWEVGVAHWFPETFYWILGCSYQGLPKTSEPIRNPIGANMAIRRKVFSSVGGFTSGIGRIGTVPLGCEETELCIRYGARFPLERFVLTRDAVVHHRVPASRLTWHYFWTRCWAEGLSKAAVSSLVGSNSGLAAERRHLMRSLPRELEQSVRSLARQPRIAATRIALILLGAAIAAGGLVRGQVAVRRSPINVDSDGSGTLATSFDGDAGPSSTSRSEPWRPVALIQIDVDTLPGDVLLKVAPGDRVWVEAVRQGQVVGRVETRSEGATLPESVLEDLATDFSDIALASKESLPDELLAKVSVVIPTICGNPDELVRTVEGLLALDYPDFEIIVVDNRSGTDHDPLPTFPGGSQVRTAVQAQRGVSAARNRGTEVASGDIVAFIDDDILVDRSWLRVIGNRFVLNAEVEAIGGLILPKEIQTESQLWFEEFYGGFSRSYSSEILSVQLLKGTDDLFPYAPGRFGSGGNMAFRRTTLERIGGFNTTLGTGTPARGGEDPAAFIEILVRGGTIAFEPAALVRHSHRRTESDFMDQVFGYGTGLTAMYTALIVRNPKHLREIIKRIPAGVRLLARPRAGRSLGQAPSYPRRTLLYQVFGLAYGPFAYARSVAQARWFS
jgi:glycosyltransferase involved in cell wall biosynthesis